MKFSHIAAASGLFVLLFTACSIPMNSAEAVRYFNASILEVGHGSYLVEITGSGTSGLNIGTEATVPADAEMPELDTGEFARVEFDGPIRETYPVQIDGVSAIFQTDDSGNILESR